MGATKPSVPWPWHGTEPLSPAMARQGTGALLGSGTLGFPPQNLARVVVWEWLNEHGRWRPYSAAVCHHIENVLKEDARGSVVLGQVDVQLAPYIIDLQSMHQFRQDTGKGRGLGGHTAGQGSTGGEVAVDEYICPFCEPLLEGLQHCSPFFCSRFFLCPSISHPMA